MICPICNKRKAKRACPARADSICAVCCGEQREVTIDCPSECIHLAASRQYDLSRLEPDWSNVPFPDVKISRQFAETRGNLLTEVEHAICIFAADHRELVDQDVLAALQALAETYRTQASGIIYERLPDYPLHRALYQHVNDAMKQLAESLHRDTGVIAVHDSDFRDVAIVLAQLCAIHQNGRPKGRAFLDMIRSQFPREEFQKTASNIVLLS